MYMLVLNFRIMNIFENILLVIFRLLEKSVVFKFKKCVYIIKLRNKQL